MQQHNNFAEKTTVERTDALVRLSDKIYPAIDQLSHGETRSRIILRLGINAIAHTLEDDGIEAAGIVYRSILKDQLERGGLTMDQLGEWPALQAQFADLPNAPFRKFGSLDELANKYADVERRTLAADLSRETNASHVTHLSVVSLAIAAELYPELNANKIAVKSSLHDMPEIYAGDWPSYRMSEADRALKHKLELASIAQINLEAGQQFPQMMNALRDYEDMKEDEDNLVYSSDKLEPNFTHLKNGGKQLLEYYDVRSRSEYLLDSAVFMDRVRSKTCSFPEIHEVTEELIFRVASKTDWPEKEAA